MRYLLILESQFYALRVKMEEAHATGYPHENPVKKYVLAPITKTLMIRMA